MGVRVRTACALVIIGVVLVGCTSTPATREDVCKSFDRLGVQLFQGNGIFGNPLFHRADELSDLAGRYHGANDLSVDAKALHDIAESDSTNGDELMSATRHIADLCGHPLGTNALFGGNP